MADTATRAVDTDDTSTKAKSRRSQLLSILGVVVLLAVLAWGGYYFMVESRYVSTDNAYVGAETATVTPLINAPVAQVLVRETQSVNAGDILVQLDNSDATLALAQAQADLARAQADAATAGDDLRRRSALAPEGAVSADELTAAQNAASTSRAALLAAQARVQAAQLALSRTTIRAPIAGVVSNKHVEIGQQVQAGAPLMVIAPINNAYVDANFKEGQLRNVHAGQAVELHSDLYGDSVTYHGTVTGLAGGTGAAFSLIPAQNASGNWIKVVQRPTRPASAKRRNARAHFGSACARHLHAGAGHHDRQRLDPDHRRRSRRQCRSGHVDYHRVRGQQRHRRAADRLADAALRHCAHLCGVGDRVHNSLFLVRYCLESAVIGCVPHFAGRGVGPDDPRLASVADHDFRAWKASDRAGHLVDDDLGGADHGANPRRLHLRQFHLALDLPDQSAGGRDLRGDLLEQSA